MIQQSRNAATPGLGVAALPFCTINGNGPAPRVGDGAVVRP